MLPLVPQGPTIPTTWSLQGQELLLCSSRPSFPLILLNLKVPFRGGSFQVSHIKLPLSYFPFISFQSFPQVVIKPVSETICDVAPSLGGKAPGDKDQGSSASTTQHTVCAP